MERDGPISMIEQSYLQYKLIIFIPIKVSCSENAVLPLGIQYPDPTYMILLICRPQTVLKY